MNTERGNRLLGAARVLAGAFIDVYCHSDKPELGTVKCKVQRIHPDHGWIVSHCGSTEMHAVWNFARCGWVFHVELDPLMKHLLSQATEQKGKVRA